MQFENIYDLTDYLEQKLGPPPAEPGTPPALFHYTDGRGFHGILTRRKVWATDYRFLNDTGEVTLGEALVDRTAETLRKELSGLQRELVDTFRDRETEDYLEQRLSKIANVFVASFSAEPNQLSQWRAYAANASGYCIGMKQLPSADAVQDEKPGVGVMPALVGVRCEYNEDSFCEKVRGALTSVAALYEQAVADHVTWTSHLSMACQWLAIQRVGMLVPRLKHSAFSEEQEWRVIVSAMPGQMKKLKLEYRVSSLGLVPYVELPLTDKPDALLPLQSVRVGPTQDPERGCDVAKTFLSGLGYDPSLVVASGIPFRAS